MERKNKELIIRDILDAVTSCKRDAEGGPVQTTQIAAKAGISTRTLNRYFPDKDALLRAAAVKYLQERYFDFAQQYYRLDKSGLNGLQRLIFFLRTQKDYYKTEPTDAVMFIDATYLCVRIAASRDCGYLSFGSEIREIVVSNLEAGIADGSIRKDADPLLISLLISASYNGLMQKLTYTFRSRLAESEKERIFTMFDEYMKMLERYLET